MRYRRKFDKISKKVVFTYFLYVKYNIGIEIDIEDDGSLLTKKNHVYTVSPGK